MNTTNKRTNYNTKTEMESSKAWYKELHKLLVDLNDLLIFLVVTCDWPLKKIATPVISEDNYSFIWTGTKSKPYDEPVAHVRNAYEK